MTHAIPYNDLKELKQHYRLTNPQIARHFGVSMSTIKRRAQKFFLPKPRTFIGSNVELAKTPPYKLAIKYGVSGSTVCAARRRLGLPALQRGRKRLFDSDVAKALRILGFTMQQTADELGVSKQAISFRANQEGWVI